MPIDRRHFLKLGSLAAVAAATGCTRTTPATGDGGSADYTLHIGSGLIELSPDHIIATTLYNQQFPGPLLRFTEGKPVAVDVYNDTGLPEQLHWHGQLVPVEIDGAAEEGTPFIAPSGRRRLRFTPGPAGLRFYHTHAHAGPDLRAGQYSGQVGIVYIEPAENPGAYDQEVFLLLKEFEPSFSQGGDMAQDFLRPAATDPALQAAGEAAMKASLSSGRKPGFEVGYGAFSVNGKMLGHADPIRVKPNTRVLFHIVNGSATEIRGLALPGHTFQVVALDGNPVPTPVEVPVLWLGTAERVSAIVRMSQPGRWILGDTSDDRTHGMGIVVEYAGASGPPRWVAPATATWDYTIFGTPDGPPASADVETIEMTVTKDNAAEQGFNRWLINGQRFSMERKSPTWTLNRGQPYRLRLHNATDDVHPIHLHRHRFELTAIAGRPTRGVLKDVVMLGGYQSMDLDFTAESPGLSLFHCHSQLHMDYGFMGLLDCRG